MENVREETAITTDRGGEIYAECVAEYVLPDYKGDIKRVMHTEARALPSGRFVGEDVTEFTGVVVFDVLYLTSDNEFASVSFSSDYSARAEKAENVRDVFADVRCEGVNVRLPGPRKISARCRAAITLLEDREIETCVSGTTFDDGSEPELCYTKVNVQRIMRGTYADREYAEELAFSPGASLDDVSVSAERGDIRVTSAASGDGAVTLGGEIAVSCLVTRGESAPRCESIRIPFDERVSVEGARDGMPAVGRGLVASLRCTPVPVDDGVRINVDVIADFEADVFSNSEIEVVKDAFSKVYDCENRYKELEYGEFLDARHTASRASREVAKKDTDAPLAHDVVYLYTTPRIETVKIEGSDVKAEGEILFSGVACEISDDASANYTGFKIGVPFAEKVNFGSQIPTDAQVECSVDASDAHVSLDGDNFYLECSVSLDVILSVKKETPCLVSSEVCPVQGAEDVSSTVCVYYPEEGDTLFGIAKRFKVSVQKIAEDNSLTEEAVNMQSDRASLLSARKLLINKM